jgi:hypothetical protein
MYILVIVTDTLKSQVYIKLPQSKPGVEKPSLMTIVTETLKSQVYIGI